MEGRREGEKQVIATGILQTRSLTNCWTCRIHLMVCFGTRPKNYPNSVKNKNVIVIYKIIIHCTCQLCGLRKYLFISNLSDTESGRLIQGVGGWGGGGNFQSMSLYALREGGREG